MQIGGLQAFSPWGMVLAAPGEKLTIEQGDTVRAFVSFNYKWLGTEPARATLHGFIGTRQVDGTFQSVADSVNPLSLAPTTEFTPVNMSVDIGTSAGVFGIGKTPPGTYDLFVMIDEYPDVNAELPQCIEITPKAGLTDMIMPMMGMTMMAMMAMMIIPMVTEEGEEGAEGIS